MNTSAIEVLGIIAITIMVMSYAFEKHHPRFVLIFAGGCALAAVYAYMIESYPFLIAESIWSVIAFKRWYAVRGHS